MTPEKAEAKADVVALRSGVLDGCSACGDGLPRVRAQGKHSVWISCAFCMARTATFLIDDEKPNMRRQDAIDRAWADWRRHPLILTQFEKARGAQVRPLRRANKDDGADPLELLARLLVPSSYRVPVEGRSSRPGMQMTDVAAALGFMRSRLAKAVAIAVVTRADEAYIARMTELARWRVRREVLMQRPVPLKLGSAGDRWKLRLALFDAAHELVWPERRRPYGVLARAAKMRKRDYMVVHRCATHVLQEALNNARSELKAKLIGGGL